MKIHLQAEVRSGLGEDTFWTWAHREWPDTVWAGEVPQEKGDVLLQYSTCGAPPPGPAKSIALCWELYPEMERKLGSNPNWAARTAVTKRSAAAADRIVVSTPLAVQDYNMFGREVDVLPIAVDGDLWKPTDNKDHLREKLGLPKDRKIGVWCGTNHPMKGFQNLIPYAQAHPDIFWVIIWKSRGEQADCPFEGKALVHAPQELMAEFYNASDFFAITGLLDPYFMCEYEAMACDLPLVDLSDRPKEFWPEYGKSRETLIKHGWLRAQAKEKWLDYIKGVSEE